MHGGGAGYFDASGNPIPATGQKVEESFDSLRTKLDNNGLIGKVRADAAGFRTLAVSYCSHDIYAGANTPDPHNPNTTPDGKPRPPTACSRPRPRSSSPRATTRRPRRSSTAAAPGSAGTFGVAWSMQLQGIAPAGVVADASIVNAEAFAAGNAAGICTDDNDPARAAAIAARVHPALAEHRQRARQARLERSAHRAAAAHLEPRRREHVRLAAGRCPLRDGSHVTMGYTDCIHEPMRAAIAAQGPGSRSMNLPRLRRQRRDTRLLDARGHQQGRAHEHRPVDARRLPHRDHDLGRRPPRRRELIAQRCASKNSTVCVA